MIKPIRNVLTDSHNVLSLVSCARDYGFEKEYFIRLRLTTFIVALCKHINGQENDCTEEDYQEVKERLTQFKETYCTKDL